ncbi:MAG: tetratricopeptide repeat protein [Acidobacteria bacterium]|nr:tetratricopeptide repeat protein [Acidobacteriota bacterium]
MKVVTAALHRDSNQVDLWLTLGRIQDARHRQESRMDAYRRVLVLKPQSAEAKLGLAQAFFDIHRLDSAVVYARALLAIGSGVRATAYYLLGRVHEQRGALDSAVVYYRSAWYALPGEPLP